MTPSQQRGRLLALVAAPAAIVGFAAGTQLGLPAVNSVLAWVREYMVPAFIELYASGIPFCG